MQQTPGLALQLALLALFLLPTGILRSEEPPTSAILSEEGMARRAEEIIQPGSAIRLFCDPCGDQYVQEVRVLSVTVEEHPNEVSPRWVLRVNGGYLPIKEIYIRREGAWQNLAHILGLAPEGVPETIYPFLRGVPVPPRE